jgi:hypothetical protein
MSITTFMDYPPKRGILWLGLSDLGRWLVRSEASDGGGGWTETYTPAGTADWGTTTNIECRIDVISGEEGRTADRISDRSTHIVTFAAGVGTASVSVDNDFQIQNRGQYEVTAIREHTNQMAAQIEVTDRVS